MLLSQGLLEWTGVFGRISDLGKVTQRRFNLAMAVVMGKELDSVVVESNRVAQVPSLCFRLHGPCTTQRL